jgi:large subunit ribosomal protein L22
MATTTATPGARATVRYLPVSPYKIRQVLDLVRGLPVDDAIRLLQLSEKGAAEKILKLLDSAVANAEHNHQLPADELYLAQAWCDEGPTRKSGQPRARGRYFRVRKRSSHVTIVLARFEADELAERRRREEASGRGAAAAQRSRAERVRRSRQRQEAAHDHDHDHDHGEEPAVDERASAEAAAEETAVAEVEETPTSNEAQTDEAPAEDAPAGDATTDDGDEAGEE